MLLEGLAALGHECLAVCPVRLVSETVEQFRAAMALRDIDVAEIAPGIYGYRHRGVEVNGLPVSTPEERRGYIVERLARFQPDTVVVSADPRYYLLESALLAAPERTVFIVHSHEHLPFGPLSGRVDARQWELLRKARTIIAVSRYSQRYLREHGGIDAAVLALPVYGTGPFPYLGNADRGFITLVAGAVLKGVPVFLELARMFPQHDFAAVPWRAVPEVLTELRATPNVRLLEPADDIECILRQTKILLAPSLFPETFGLIVVEAMLRGIPVLASDLGGLREAKLGTDYLLPIQPLRMLDGKLWNPPQDLTAWRQALQRMLSDRGEYGRISLQSRNAAARFVSTVSVRPFEDLLRQAAAEPELAPVAVIDPFDAGFMLTQELDRRGRPCVSVESSDQIYPGILAKCDRSLFRAVIRHQGDLDETIGELRRLKVSAVLAGCETGVLLFDRVSEGMQFCSNGTALSEARRNKVLMSESAGRLGIPVAAQRASNDWEEIRQWAGEQQNWPLVAKPPHSLGSEDVRVCRNESELASAFQYILNRRNLCGVVNHVVLVQELLEGTQYVLDTISRDGQHFLAGVWEYGRPEFAAELLSAARGGPWPCSIAHLSWEDVNYASVGSNSKAIRPGDDTVAEALFRYAARVLDALGIRHGPAHFELMWTAGGIRLVEVGARLHGAPSTHWMCRICTGTSQLDQTIDAHLDSDRFFRQASRSYVLGCHGFNFRLHPYREGWLNGFRGLDRIERLESFRSFFYMAKPGRVKPLDCVGVVALIHPDQEVVHEDCRSIRALEKQDLFEIECEHSYHQASK
jgi:biotin carboxylase/glycosyltransferase involved in cell wall biosynthesis